MVVFTIIQFNSAALALAVHYSPQTLTRTLHEKVKGSFAERTHLRMILFRRVAGRQRAKTE